MYLGSEVILTSQVMLKEPEDPDAYKYLLKWKY